MPFLTQKQLRKVLDDECFYPTKEMGQNYLVDKQICHQILHELNPQPNDQVLEIGSGFGAFTDEIVSKTKRTYIIEKERISAKFLADHFNHQYSTIHLKPKSQITWNNISPDNQVVIFESDAQKIPFPSVNKLISSVPYSIVFPLMIKIIHSWMYDHVILIVQKEVADRLLATSGTPGYNVLAAFTGFYTKSSLITKIPKSSFYPEPEVESVMMKIIPRPTLFPNAIERQVRAEYELFLRGLFREMTWSLNRAIIEMQKKKPQIFQQFPFLVQKIKDSEWENIPVRNIPTESLFQFMTSSLPRKYQAFQNQLSKK